MLASSSGAGLALRRVVGGHYCHSHLARCVDVGASVSTRLSHQTLFGTKSEVQLRAFARTKVTERVLEADNQKAAKRNFLMGILGSINCVCAAVSVGSIHETMFSNPSVAFGVIGLLSLAAPACLAMAKQRNNRTIKRVVFDKKAKEFEITSYSMTGKPNVISRIPAEGELKDSSRMVSIRGEGSFFYITEKDAIKSINVSLLNKYLKRV